MNAALCVMELLPLAKHSCQQRCTSGSTSMQPQLVQTFTICHCRCCCCRCCRCCCCSPFLAARYHSLLVAKETCPEDLEVTAWTEDGSIMAMMHKKYPHIQGVQFHPESIITQNGKRIIGNWVKSVKQQDGVTAGAAAAGAEASS